MSKIKKESREKSENVNKKLIFDEKKSHNRLNRLLVKNSKSIPDKLFNEAVKDRALRRNDSVLLLFISREALSNKRGYCDTYANELKDIIGCTSKEAVSRAVHRLADAGYIVIELVPYKHDKVKHHYRFYIHKSKLIAMTNRDKNIHSMDISKSYKSIRKEKKTKQNKKEKAISVIVNIEGREKPKNTTVQDMLNIYNELSGGCVTFEDAYKSKLMRYMYVAYVKKFRSLERWRRYIKRSIFGMIKNSKRFLYYLLVFSNIDTGIAAIEKDDLTSFKYQKYLASVEQEYENIKAEIESLNEPDEVKAAYAKILRRGPAVYRNWTPYVKIIKGDFGLEVVPSSSAVSDFAADYVKVHFL